MESILLSIKKLLGIAEDYTQFDTDIIIHINSVLGILNQVGVGEEGFTINNSTATWVDFLGSAKNYESVKTYTYLRVRLLFDPPTATSAVDCMTRVANELEWRLSVAADK